MKKHGKKWIIGLSAAVLTVAAAAAVFFSVPAFGKYSSKVSQSFTLTVNPTKPVLAEQGDWYRGGIPESSIKTVAFAEADYLSKNPDLSYEESFFADAKNIGTIQCYVVKDANEDYGLIVSGNNFGDSDTVYANVNSSGMFSEFTALTEITGADKIDFKAVTDFSDMFSGCSALVAVSGMSSRSTAAALDMSGMFSGCASLAAIDVSSFNTAKVTDFSDMFSGCASVGELDCSGFDSSAALNMSGMFSGCTSLYRLTLGADFTAEKVTDFSEMFKGTQALTSVDLSSVSADAAVTVSEMFSGSGIVSLDLSWLNTAALVNTAGMFENCSALTAISVPLSADFSAVTDSSDMFTGCTAIVGQHGTTYNGLKTDKEYARIDSTNFKGYFKGETAAITFDANGGSGSLPTQHIVRGASDTLTPLNGAITREHFIFGGWSSNADGTGTIYADGGAITGPSEDCTLYAIWKPNEATFISGYKFVKKVKGYLGYTSGIQTDTILTSILRSTSAPADGTDVLTLSTEDSVLPIVGWFEGTDFKYYSEAEVLYLNENAASMLIGFKGLTTADVEEWDTSRCTNFSNIFCRCGLTNADFSSWDTSKATDMNNMFSNSSFISLDLSSFDTSNVKNMYCMFNSLSSLTSVNVSSFDTSKVCNMEYMFAFSDKLTTINISSFSTESLAEQTVELIYGHGCNHMFRDCTSLTTIYASSAFDTSVLSETPKYYNYMFTNDTNLVGGAGTPYDPLNVSGVYARIDSTSNPGYFTGNTKQICFHSSTVPESTKKQFVIPGTADTLIPNTFTCTGYTFAGWNTSISGTGTAYADGASITRSATDPDVLDLYARWSENSYTVSMDINGGSWVNAPSSNPASRLYTAAYTLPTASDVSRTGYTFGGWSEFASGSGAVYTQVPANTTENKTFYAKWEENTYTVTYEKNGGTFASTPQATRLYSEAVTLPTASGISKTGYTFGGWYDNEALSGTAVTAIDANTAENKTFYAKWTPITYTVRFNSNGGQADQARYIPAITATYGESFSLPYMESRFVRSGYSFAGYDMSMSATIPTYSEGESVSNLSSVNGSVVTLYCIWSYDVSVWDSGQAVNAKLKSLVNPGAAYTDSDNRIAHFVKSATAPAANVQKTVISRSNSAGKTYAWYESDTNTVYWYSLSGDIYAGKDSSYMFAGMTALTDIDLDGVSFVNSSTYLTQYSTVENVAYMFENCSALLSAPAEVTNNLSKVTDITGMFSGCASLTTVDLSGLKSAVMTDMHEMFKGCAGITDIYLNDIDTSAVTDMHGMFEGCSSLVNLGIGDIRTENVTDMSRMFYGCSSLTRLNIWGFDTSSVTSCADMFTGTNLHEVDVAAGMTGAVQTELYNLKTWYTPYDLSQQYTTELASGTTAQVTSAAQMNKGAFFDHSSLSYATFNVNFDLTCKNLALVANGEEPRTNHNFADIYIESFRRSMTPAPSGAATASLGTNVVGWYDNGTIWYYISCDRVNANQLSFNEMIRINSVDISGMCTSSVTSMSGWFQNTKCKRIDTCGFDTSKVTNLSTAFNQCQKLMALDVSGWNTENLTTLYQTFRVCTSLTSLDLSDWKTGKLASLSQTFYNCASLTSLDVSGWDTSNVYDMLYAFAECKKLNDVDVSDFNTSNVISMSRMFQNCGSLTYIDVSGWNTSKVENMSFMFDGCSSLASLDVRGWNTEKVTNMGALFKNCSKLSSVDVSNFNTSKVTGMGSMFYNCSKLSFVDVSNFDTSNVTDMAYMFNNCNRLTSLDAHGWNTGKATSTARMFQSCSSLTNLDLTGWNTSKVTDMAYMFQSCSALTTIRASASFVTTAATSYANMFTGCTALVGGNGTPYSSLHTDKEYARIDLDGQPGYFTATLATLYDGEDFNAAIKTLAAGTRKTANDVDNTVTAILRSGTAPTGATVDISPAGDIVAWLDGSVVYWYSGASSIFMPSDCSGMFKNFAALTAADIGLNDNDVDITAIRDISEMFKGCSSMADIYFNDIDTSSITDMHGMFEGCSSLVNLGIGDIRTENVTDMSRMFYGCSSLTRLNIWGFDTSSVTACADMFTGAALHEVDVAAGMTGAVQTELYNLKTWYTPYDLSQQYTTELASGTTAQVTSAAQMNKGAFFDHSTLSYASFANNFNLTCKNLARVANGQTALTGNYTDEYIKSFRRSLTPAPSGAATASLGTNVVGWYDNGTIWYYTSCDRVNSNQLMFYSMSNINSVDISGIRTSTSTTMREWFKNVKCGRIDACGFDTSKATTLSNTFADCNNLRDVDVSGWNTVNITDMTYLFSRCSSLTSANVSGWNTGNVTSLVGTFYFCSALTSLDLSSWDTSKVTSLSQSFEGCHYLASLDVSCWNTGNLISLANTFRDCRALTMLDVSGWDTGKVQSMYYSFYNCAKLTSLDVSDWNTENVTNMQQTFCNCTALTSLDLSGWDTGNVTTLLSTFNGCSGLTSLDVSDWNTGNVTNMQGTFQNCSALTSLDVSRWNIVNVTTLQQTFYYCKALASLDVSGWNTENVQTMYCTFTGCKALTSLDLEGWVTSSVTNSLGMFDSCENLKTIYVSESFVTTAMTNSSNMFNRCFKLVGENGTSYKDKGTRDKTYARIDSALAPGYFTANAEYDVKYFDLAYTGETEAYFLPDYQTGGAKEGDVVRLRKLSQSVTLPTEDMLVVPTGKKLDGWLERTDTGWKTTPVYSIPEGERGVYELTPNWVDATAAMSFDVDNGSLRKTE